MPLRRVFSIVMQMSYAVGQRYLQQHQDSSAPHILKENVFGMYLDGAKCWRGTVAAISDGNPKPLIGHGEASAYRMLGVEDRITTLCILEHFKRFISPVVDSVFLLTLLPLVLQLLQSAHVCA